MATEFPTGTNTTSHAVLLKPPVTTHDVPITTPETPTTTPETPTTTPETPTTPEALIITAPENPMMTGK